MTIESLTELTTPATGDRRRIFFVTAAIATGVWFLVAVATAIVGAVFLTGWYGYSGNLQTALQCFDKTQEGISTAIALQVAVWWHWRIPNRSPKAHLVRLIGFFTVLSIVGLLTQMGVVHVVQSSPLTLVVWAAFGSLIIPMYLIGMCIPSQFWQFQLVDRSQLDLAAEATFASIKGWSIKGLFLTTLLVAIVLALYQAMRRIYESTFDSAMMIQYPGNDLWLFLSYIGSIATSLMVLWGAACSMCDSGRRRGILLLFAAVGFESMLQLINLTLYNPGQDIFVDMWKETLFNNAIAGIVTYQISRWFFRRWQQAGYKLIGWVRGQGSLPPPMPDQLPP
ncbi:hypothetical protein [Novipirellula artificiosorum]|uniref:Uncharacterized protein n=1 Tax=Novipirellula artificiosorum TaxID=2528016 RepID=A0A5C6E017_9BACT|nr:hypothetical protein [Novipirellula artificiosorum]TWU42212.1 hypothetical protein Poly41_05080 [Novipirellula artificiosorum]